MKRVKEVFWFIWMMLLSVGSLMGETYYIGVSLPLSGSKQDRGDRILAAMEMAVDKINKDGFLGGHRLEMIVMDDANQTDLARVNSEKLSADKRVLAVIGHYDASIALAGAENYNKNQLVLYSPSVGAPSYLQGEYCYSGTISDNVQAEDMAAYLFQILKVKNVAIIYASGNYGTMSMLAFSNKAESIGMRVKAVSFNEKAERLDEGFISGNFDKKDKLDALVIFAHADKGIPIIKQIRDFGLDAPIYGGDRISSGLLEELTLAYKKALFVSFPFMYDFASMEAYEFGKAYKKRYKNEPSIWAGFAYDGVYLIAQAIKEKGATRQAVKEYFDSLAHEDEGFEGMTGKLFFNKDHSMNRTIVMSRISSDGDMFKPLYDQIKEVTDNHTLKQIEKKVKAGENFVIGEKPYYNIQLVYVGIDFARLNKVDIKENTFSLDFYLWFRWSGDLDIENVIFPNNANDIVLSDLRSDLSGLVKWQSFRANGTFMTKFDLRKYPYDSQKMPIFIAHKNKNGNKIQFIVDRERIRSMTLKDIPDEWYYTGRQDSGGTYTIDSVFGNPSYRIYEKQAPFSRIQTDIDVTRNLFPYVLNLFLPLVIVLFLSLMTFILPKDEFGMKFDGYVMGILTIVVFQMTQSDKLPPLGYPTVCDIYFMISYVYIFTMAIKFYIFTNVYKKRSNAGEDLQGLIRIDNVLSLIVLFGAILTYVIFTAVAILA